MIVNFKNHWYYYLSLLGIVFLGVFLAFQLAYDRRLQVFVVVATALFYVFWGILHHFLEHDLNIKIVVEYILVGSLGMTIVLFLLKTV